MDSNQQQYPPIQQQPQALMQNLSQAHPPTPSPNAVAQQQQAQQQSQQAQASKQQQSQQPFTPVHNQMYEMIRKTLMGLVQQGVPGIDKVLSTLNDQHANLIKGMSQQPQIPPQLMQMMGQQQGQPQMPPQGQPPQPMQGGQ